MHFFLPPSLLCLLWCDESRPLPVTGRAAAARGGLSPCQSDAMQCVTCLLPLMGMNTAVRGLVTKFDLLLLIPAIYELRRVCRAKTLTLRGGSIILPFSGSLFFILAAIFPFHFHFHHG